MTWTNYSVSPARAELSIEPSVLNSPLPSVTRQSWPSSGQPTEELRTDIHAVYRDAFPCPSHRRLQNRLLSAPCAYYLPGNITYSRLFPLIRGYFRAAFDTQILKPQPLTSTNPPLWHPSETFSRPGNPTLFVRSKLQRSTSPPKHGKKEKTSFQARGSLIIGEYRFSIGPVLLGIASCPSMEFRDLT